MRSEQQHIDDFFRKKEEEYQQGTGDADINWQQMKALLTPGVPPAPKGYRFQATRRIIKYLGGFTVVTVITLVTLTTLKTKKKAPAEKPLVNKTMTAPKKQLAVNQPAALRDTTARPVKRTITRRPVKKTVPKTVKPPVEVTLPQPAQRTTNSQIVNLQTVQPKESISNIAITGNELKAATPVVEVSSNVLNATQQLNAFYKQLEKAGQQFVIDVNKDTTLVTKEGTRLTIPAQAFANKKGVIKNGVVTIVLREYYTYEDILAAKLSTTSGGEQLISGGMVHIAAEAFGEEAKIAARKNIKLEMPTTKYDEQMQLFRGMRSSLKNAFVAKFMDNRMIDTIRFMKREADENGDLDWIPEGQEQKVSERLNRKIKVLDIYDNPYRVTSGKKVTAYFNIAKECPLSDEEMAEKLKTTSTVRFDEIKVRRLKRAPKVDLMFQEDPIPVAGDSITILFSEAVRRNMLTPEATAKVLEQFRQDSIAREERVKLMGKYSFTITNLGWLNCDRFNNSPGPRTLFTFRPGDGFEPTTMVSHLVFTRYRSILPGSYKEKKISFGKVPRDEPVKIVCIGVKNGKIMACIQSLNADKEEISDLAFTETTPEQFKQKLQTLGLGLP